ncbi:environmental stress-induced protein Ves [Aeromonas sp. BIGb0405]|nr:HutD family protein [Aeromonas sp. BIGb0405]MCS3454514.1 environmental stress-induced protein Ves [Aeromonas sp. BIGb0405]
MYQLITVAQQRKMPWKNGKGSTAEIVIAPAGSSLAKLDFDYRLSTAPIKEAGPFSPFPGYARILLPVSGAGFVLNGHPYATFEAAHFSGDDETHCALLKKEVTDLGLIYDATKLDANVRVLTLPFSVPLTLEPAHTYLVTLLEGSLKVAEHDLAKGDTLLVSAQESIMLECSKKATIAFFTLRQLTTADTRQ